MALSEGESLSSVRSGDDAYAADGHNAGVPRTDMPTPRREFKEMGSVCI